MLIKKSTYYTTYRGECIAAFQSGPLIDYMIAEHGTNIRKPKVGYLFMDENQTFEENSTSTIYQCKRDGEYTSLFFVNKEDCKDENPEFVDVTFLHTVYGPIRFPQEVTLYRGAKGTPMCRMRVRPDIVGYSSEGLVVFPHKKWSDATFGKAVITKVIVKDTYGFAYGKMVKYVIPEDTQKIIEWASNVFKGNIYIMKGTPRGDYIAAFSRDSGISARIYQDESGQYVYEDFPYIEDDLTAHSYSYMEKVDLSGTYSEMFDCPDFGPNSDAHRAIVAEWTTEGAFTEEDDLIAKAMMNGAIVKYTAAGIDAYVYEVGNKKGLLVFPEATVKELAERINAKNKEASEIISSKLRKGRIQLKILS